MINSKVKPQAVVADAHEDTIRSLYMESLHLVERLHRRLLDVIKDEFDRAGRSDVNSVQALLLFNVGDAELTAGELKSRGHYQGSNVSYNLKKLIECGYIAQERSPHDRRSVRIKLSERGLELQRKLDAVEQLAQLAEKSFGPWTSGSERRSVTAPAVGMPAGAWARARTRSASKSAAFTAATSPRTIAVT